MRPVDIWLNSATFSNWVQLDYLQNGFAVGLGFSVSSGATLTASVQHTFDDIQQNDHPVSATQSGNTITVVDTGFSQIWSNTNSLNSHCLSVGDWVYLTGSQANMDGQYSVASIVSATSYTLTSTVSQTATAGPGLQAATARVYNHATMSAITSRLDGNYAFPPCAVRLLVTAYTSGIASLAIRQGMGSR